MCYAAQRHCRHPPNEQPPEDPECELSIWTDWSSCSSTCGTGYRTRSRKYRNRFAAKRCAAGKENPPRLEETTECVDLIECEDENQVNFFFVPKFSVNTLLKTSIFQKEPDCSHVRWSEWEQCSATCGKGIKKRYRLEPPSMLPSYYKRRPYKYSQEEENTESVVEENASDPCADLTEQVVECVNEDLPNCEENTEHPDGTIN